MGQHLRRSRSASDLPIPAEGLFPQGISLRRPTSLPPLRQYHCTAKEDDSPPAGSAAPRTLCRLELKSIPADLKFSMRRYRCNAEWRLEHLALCKDCNGGNGETAASKVKCMNLRLGYTRSNENQATEAQVNQELAGSTNNDSKGDSKEVDNTSELIENNTGKV